MKEPVLKQERFSEKGKEEQILIIKRIIKKLKENGFSAIADKSNINFPFYQEETLIYEDDIKDLSIKQGDEYIIVYYNNKDKEYMNKFIDYLKKFPFKLIRISDNFKLK
jgi:hypothetical protein